MKKFVIKSLPRTAPKAGTVRSALLAITLMGTVTYQGDKVVYQVRLGDLVQRFDNAGRRKASEYFMGEHYNPNSVLTFYKDEYGIVEIPA